MTAPLLVFGWGNLSRGDDALGPLFIRQVRALVGAQVGAQVGDAGAHRVEFLEDYQLQVEHALDLADRERVLFVDASVDCAAPFEATVLQPARHVGVTTHAMSPSAVMQVFRDLHHAEPPPCTLLAIRGESFDLGEPPGQSALANLGLAVAWGVRWLGEPG